MSSGCSNPYMTFRDRVDCKIPLEAHVSPEHIIQPSPNSIDSLKIPHINYFQKLLQSMPSHKATGLDDIRAKVLKIAGSAISLSLSRLIKRCCSKFLLVWKSAKVTPIYKGHGNKQDMNKLSTYICTTPPLKASGKACSPFAVYRYFKNNNILYQFQAGLSKWYSTETALIRIIDQLLIDQDVNSVSGLFYIDYKKAFDLILQIMIFSFQSLESVELNQKN